MRLLNHQKHKDSCGPVAVMNVMKFLGGSISYKDVDLFKIFGWSIETESGGMYHHRMSKCLDFFKIKYRESELTSSWCISQALKRSKVVIIAYKWFHYSKTGGHFAVIYKNNDQTFKGLNLDSKGNQYLNKKDLDSWLKKTKPKYPEYTPKIWEIL